MKLPPGLTEAEVLAALDRVLAMLAPSFVFGYYDIEDVEQFGRLEGLKLLAKGKYDGSRPLDAYLYTHIFRRLLNLQRKLKWRSEPSCPQCASGTTYCGDGHGPCDAHEAWVRRNTTKSALTSPVSLDSDHDGRDRADVMGEIERRETEATIDAKLPAALRSDYLRLKAGVTVPARRKAAVLEAVREALGWPNADA